MKIKRLCQQPNYIVSQSKIFFLKNDDDDSENNNNNNNIEIVVKLADGR